MKIKLLLIASLIPCFVNAQKLVEESPLKRLSKFPVLTSDYIYYPSADFSTENSNGTVTSSEWRTTLQFAIPLKEKKTYLFNGIQHSMFHFNLETDQQAYQNSETYQSFQYRLGLIKVLPKRWTLSLTLVPTIASDFNAPIESDDFVIHAAAMAIKRSGTNFQYGFGLAYTSRFGNLTLVPLFSLTRKVGNWQTIGVLPTYLSHYYEINDQSKVGITLNINGNLYNVTLDQNYSSFDLNRVAYSRITVGPEYLHKLFGDLYLSTSTGISLRNLVEVQDDQLNKELDFDIKSRFYFNIGLRIMK